MLEQADSPAQGASGANGAQLSYAYVQPLADPSIWLQLPQLLLARDSPLALRQRLRIAGMAELTHARDQAIAPQRIAALLETAREVFPAGGDYQRAAPWAGLRPATPRGLPVLGRLPGGPANLLMNTGHGALGFTLAFGSARRLAAQAGSLHG